MVLRQFPNHLVTFDSFKINSKISLLKEIFAISLVKNDWILFLDADERLSEKLKIEILETLKNNETFTAFMFYRTFMFKNKVLRFSGWQTDKIFRLFHKNFATYTSERLVHEKTKVEGEVGSKK